MTADQYLYENGWNDKFEWINAVYYSTQLCLSTIKSPAHSFSSSSSSSSSSAHNTYRSIRLSDGISSSEIENNIRLQLKIDEIIHDSYKGIIPNIVHIARANGKHSYAIMFNRYFENPYTYELDWFDKKPYILYISTNFLTPTDYYGKKVQTPLYGLKWSEIDGDHDFKTIIDTIKRDYQWYPKIDHIKRASNKHLYAIVFKEKILKKNGNYLIDEYNLDYFNEKPYILYY